LISAGHADLDRLVGRLTGCDATASIFLTSGRTMATIRVVMAGQRSADRDACRASLRPEPDIQLVGEAVTWKEAITALELKPRVLLLELMLLRDGDPAALLGVLRHSANTRVLLLTHESPPPELFEALCQGAVGYVVRTAGLATMLPKAVRAVARGEAWIPRHAVGELVGRLSGLSSIGAAQSLHA
jgi:DNA-binding NarL/FixJ family response regulator